MFWRLFALASSRASLCAILSSENIAIKKNRTNEEREKNWAADEQKHPKKISISIICKVSRVFRYFLMMSMPPIQYTIHNTSWHRHFVCTLSLNTDIYLFSIYYAPMFKRIWNEWMQVNSNFWRIHTCETHGISLRSTCITQWIYFFNCRTKVKDENKTNRKTREKKHQQ